MKGKGKAMGEDCLVQDISVQSGDSFSKSEFSQSLREYRRDSVRTKVILTKSLAATKLKPVHDNFLL